MFDSHCHLHDPQIVRNAAEMIERAHQAGVSGFLLAGVDPDGWLVEETLAATHEQVWISVGVHPQRVAELEEAAAQEMVDALETALENRSNKVVAIGEIGLDGAEGRKASRGLQERIFRRQLKLAQEHNLPVALHVLDAHPAALDLLREEPVARGGVLHSCSASAELVADYLALGFHISFAGPVTNAAAKRTHRSARAVPAHRLLVETDAPFQTPQPHRPALNEPAFLAANLEALAQIREESIAEVAQYTDDNARRLFGIQ